MEKNWAIIQLKTMWNNGSWITDYDYGLCSWIPTIYISNRLQDYVRDMPEMVTFGLTSLLPWEMPGEHYSGSLTDKKNQ